MIVIGVGGLLFIIVFGVSVVSSIFKTIPAIIFVDIGTQLDIHTSLAILYFQLVNRQNGSKLKPSISAIYEEEVAKNMNHIAPPSRQSNEYPKNDTMWTEVGWNEKSFESTSNKVA